jgi:AcrR family transcriptional regulator
MNGMSSEQRKYRLKARAERQQRTRERIVLATVALHREVGPARTTVAEVARRAGVQRLTVYNNFPEPRDLLVACQRHFLSENPPPVISPEGYQGDPLDRLEQALCALYGWYRANADMQRGVQGDRHLLPELDDLMRLNADPHLDETAVAHAERLATSGEDCQPVYQLVRLAMDFRTWQVLADHGASDSESARLLRLAMAGIVAGAN